MSTEVIVCPYCQREIPLNEALSHRITENVRAEFEARAREREGKLAERERVLADKQQKMEEARRALDEEVAEKLAAEKAKLLEDAKKKADEEAALEITDLQRQLAEKSQKLKESAEMELELRKERQELQEAREKFDLELQRRLDEERQQIRESVSTQMQEEYRLKQAQDKLYTDSLKKQIEDLKRRAEQGSQQAQGEALEIELEDILASAFIYDKVEPVPKGIRGADVLQHICTPTGQHCGTIVWEAKRTKNWGNDWVLKLKDDKRELGADVAVLVTTTMPKGMDGFGLVEGVWVSDFKSAIGLATALRMQLIEVARVKQDSVGKQEKMEVLYHYLSGPEFKARVEAIVETFDVMKRELDKEKRTMMSSWARREKQIDRIVLNTAGMHGELQGILGSSLPEIESLDLEALPAATAESLDDME